MPIYEYVCQSCGAEIEVLHGLNEPGPAACDVCGGPMRKRLAPPAIVFRGSGWAKKERREAASTAPGGGAKAKADGDGPAKDTAGAAGASGKADANAAGAGDGKGKADGGTAGGQAKDASAG